MRKKTSSKCGTRPGNGRYPSGEEGEAAALEQYLTTIGRRKLIVPLYRELAKTPEGLAFAQRVYAAAKPMYTRCSTSATVMTA